MICFKLSHSIDINLGFDLSSQFRSTSCAVVDVGEWFDREFNVEEIKFTSRGILRELEYKPIVSLLKVKKMRILLGHHTEKEKSQADVIYSIIKSLGKIDRVEAEIDFQTIHQMNEIYRQMRLNKDKDDQENKNITISINTSITTEKPFRTRAMRDYSCLIKHLNIAKIKRIKDMNGLSSLNWQSLAKLNISSMPFEPIMTADFTSLRSLKYLALSGLRRDSMLDDSHINWAFLDPVRDNLEELSFYSNEFQNISWKAFVGMHRLKCLIIREEKIDQIEIDSQGQLFADLQALKQLELSLTDIIMTTNWNLSLLALENLKPHPIAEITSCGISIQFNLPKLNSLTLSFSCYQFSNENISLLVEPFKDVQELYLYLPDLSCLKRGYFRDFKYLRKLWLETEENKDEVDQQVFDGLESLVELNIYTHLLQPGALSRLKNLEHIKIRSLRHDIANENYQQLFDGLESLKTFRIEKNYPEYSECQTSQSFVYFQNLDKVVFENIAF